MKTLSPTFRALPLCGTSMVLGCLLMAAGCDSNRPRPMSPDLPPPPAFVDAPRNCTSARIHFALKQRISRPLLEEMRMRSGAAMARAMLPDDAPLPFRADRLLVEVAPDGRVVAARCA